MLGRVLLRERINDAIHRNVTRHTLLMALSCFWRYVFGLNFLLRGGILLRSSQPCRHRSVFLLPFLVLDRFLDGVPLLHLIFLNRSGIVHILVTSFRDRSTRKINQLLNFAFLFWFGRTSLNLVGWLRWSCLSRSVDLHSIICTVFSLRLGLSLRNRGQVLRLCRPSVLRSDQWQKSTNHGCGWDCGNLGYL